MSATYPALVSPSVPQLPLDRFGNLYPTVSGTWPGLGVVDLDTNVIYRLAIYSGSTWRSSPDEALFTKCHHRSEHLEFCHTNIYRRSCLVCVFHNEICLEICRRIEVLKEDTVKLGGGGVIVWGAVSQSYIVCWAPVHDTWLTEWSRLHGYPKDNSLVSSAHPLGYYGVNYVLLTGRQYSLPQSCNCHWMEGTTWRP